MAPQHNKEPKSKKRKKSALVAGKSTATEQEVDEDHPDSKNNNSYAPPDDHPDDKTYLGRCDAVSDRYEKMGRRLGQGTYGIVYQARDQVTGRYVALKRCIPHHEASDGFPITTLREIQSLRLCSSHPNIVHLENVAVSRSGVFLVFEYW